MAEIRVPTLGESVTEATIGKWFKQPGEVVAVDEPLVELETDKVTIEVPALAAGAGTSMVTLSVSSSTSGSSTATASPGFLNHLPMVASVIDSPSVGTRTSAMARLSFRSAVIVREGGRSSNRKHRR